MLNYPITLTFKLFTFAPQISVTDHDGNEVLHVKQKLFKLKEAISVWADHAQTQLRYRISADRIIDFSAAYTFTDDAGQPVGSVKRRGMRSLWRAHYDIFAPGQPDTPILTIREENPWVKVIDGILGEIVLIGFFSGFIFNPVYLVQRPDETVVMRLEKIPTLLSRKFTIKQVDALDEPGQEAALLSLLMMLLLERSRG